MSTKRLVIGCGYLGMRVAKLWQAEPSTVFALTRRSERAAEFAEQGWMPLLGDLCGQLPAWPDVDTALLAVGFDRQSGHSIEDVYVGGIERLIETLPDSISRLIYISSTGVFGSAEGEWLDESSACQPKRPGAVASLAAEKKLAASRFADRLIVLRLAGIYGPHRIPRLAALTEGKSIDADPEGFLNLIHVDDAANIVCLAEQQAAAPNMYCVSDGAPVRRGEFLKLACQEMNLPSPTFSQSDNESPTEASGRRRASKRIRNQKLLRELPVQLQYPSYFEGLPQAIRNSASL